MESGIYNDGESSIFIIFGGKINIGIGTMKYDNYKAIGFQELNKKVEIGTEYAEAWDKNKPTIHLLFDKKEEIDAVINGLKKLREKF